MTIINNIQSNQTISLNSEKDLQFLIVEFLRSDPYWLYTCIQGELQVTPAIRINSKMSGYTSGSPDLILFNANSEFNGILIELKTPNGLGTLSDVQKLFHIKANEKNNYLIIVSNNYTEIIELLIKYKYNIKISKSSVPVSVLTSVQTSVSTSDVPTSDKSVPKSRKSSNHKYYLKNRIKILESRKSFKK
jgi:hypothetical protein